jgi:predicted RNA-binding Zn-ribbon protein involved in translation (DUF1610 family)
MMNDPSLGAALAARRKAKNKECPVCGRRFVTKGRGLYCSPSCGQKARRQRDKAALAAHPTERQQFLDYSKVDATGLRVVRNAQATREPWDDEI